MRTYPKVGDNVLITAKGGSNKLPFEVVVIDKKRRDPVCLQHRFGGLMWFRRAELILVPTEH
jgi:hypothetical protein